MPRRLQVRDWQAGPRMTACREQAEPKVRREGGPSRPARAGAATRGFGAGEERVTGRQPWEQGSIPRRPRTPAKEASQIERAGRSLDAELARARVKGQTLTGARLSSPTSPPPLPCRESSLCCGHAGAAESIWGPDDPGTGRQLSPIEHLGRYHIGQRVRAPSVRQGRPGRKCRPKGLGSGFRGR